MDLNSGAAPQPVEHRRALLGRAVEGGPRHRARVRGTTPMSSIGSRGQAHGHLLERDQPFHGWQRRVKAG
jgi:hypothetical protein